MKVQNKSNQKNRFSNNTINWLVGIPLSIFIVKLILITNIESGIWYGSDTESYVEGGNALLLEGLTSESSKLTYLPAGYSFILFFCAKISVTYFSYILAVVQSLLFAYATFRISNTVYKLGNSKLAILSSFLISTNLTLTLSSLVIGYECLVASFLAIAVSILTDNSGKDRIGSQIKVILIPMFFVSLASALQPRYLLIGFGIILVYCFHIDSRKIQSAVLLLGISLSMLFPVGLAIRNQIAIDHAVISYNLGATMKIGAGPDTKGGFSHQGRDIECGNLSSDPVRADSQVVKCVTKWYLSNPADLIRLSFNKSIYFWSPWFGALAEGTMARNPWVSISPVIKMAANPDSRSLVLGPIGKTISYFWILLQLSFVIIGYLNLRKVSYKHKLLANFALGSILLSWITSIGTIGDHRFRIPVMMLSLLLQSVAISKFKDRLFRAV